MAAHCRATGRRMDERPCGVLAEKLTADSPFCLLVGRQIRRRAPYQKFHRASHPLSTRWAAFYDLRVAMFCGVLDQRLLSLPAPWPADAGRSCRAGVRTRRACGCRVPQKRPFPLCSAARAAPRPAGLAPCLQHVIRPKTAPARCRAFSLAPRSSSGRQRFAMWPFAVPALVRRAVARWCL